jgi:polysaccharide pyruvyl transferase WcaK-like protein
VKSSIEETSSHYNLSWLLLPHDNRADAGDIIAMKNLYTTLAGEKKDNIFLVKTPPTAAEIKEIVGEVDGVITGRMHLSIAALGRSKPVMVFSYQGKFSGLLAHFALPNWLELDPIESSQENFLKPRFNKFILELSWLQKQVEAELPKVKTLALATFKEIKNA